MTFFRDRYQGVGAIAAHAPAPRSAPAPTIRTVRTRVSPLLNTPELENPRFEYEKGRTFISMPTMPARVKAVRGSGSRGPLLMSGIRNDGPIMEVEQRVAPLAYGSRLLGGPRSVMRRPGALSGSGNARNGILIGTGIGTPRALPVDPQLAIQVGPPLPQPTWGNGGGSSSGSGTGTFGTKAENTGTTPSNYTLCWDGSSVPTGIACPPPIVSTMPLPPDPGSPPQVVPIHPPPLVQVAPPPPGATPASSSSSAMPILLVGGGVLALYLLFRK